MKRKKHKARRKALRLSLIITVLFIALILKFGGERDEYLDDGTKIVKDQSVSTIAPTTPPVPTAEAVDHEKEQLKAQIREIGAKYRDIYEKCEKIPSPYFNDREEYISQKSIDEIEQFLIDEGYNLINSDAIYPSYIENPAPIYHLWDSVERGETAQAAIWGVGENGGLYYRRLRCKGVEGSCLNVNTSWNEKGELEITSYEHRDIFNWLMTEQGLIYQDMVTDRHWTASKLLRLHSVDKTLYELNRRYILPIGYKNLNFFLVDWDSGNFGELCFNDLFYGMYKLDNNVQIDTTVYPYLGETGYRAIPAETFEKTLLHHFEISQNSLRTLAHYDASYDAYPYNNNIISYDSYYPELIADVIEYTELGGGQIRLLVNVMCPDLHCGSVFRHEVTLKLLQNGDFQYLSNRITFKAEVEQPSSKPGIA